MAVKFDGGISRGRHGQVGDLSDANFPMDAEGRVYHLGVKYGEGMLFPPRAGVGGWGGGG